MQMVRVTMWVVCIALWQVGCCCVEQHSDAPVAVEKVQVERLVQSTHSWDGALLPAYPEGQPEVTILRITIPAGMKLDMHSHPVINAGVVLSGELTVITVDGQENHLKAGEPIVEVVRTLHYGENRGDVPVQIIVFYAGVVDVPNTIIAPK